MHLYLSKESQRKIEELNRIGVLVDFAYSPSRGFYICFIESDNNIIYVPDTSKQFAFSKAYAAYLEEVITRGKEVQKLG